MKELDPVSLSSRRLLPALAIGVLLAGLLLGQIPALRGHAAGPRMSGPLACSSATITAPGFTFEPGDGTVDLTASSTNCTSPVYMYLLKAPGSTTWKFMTGYTAATTFVWTTAGQKQGVWQIGVWARDVTSTASYQAYGISSVSLSIPYCTGAHISASPASPQPSGTSVTFTAESSGCTSPIYKFLELAPGSSTWVVKQAYPNGNSGPTTYTTVVGTAGVNYGVYQFGVWAKNFDSEKSYDSYAVMTFQATPSVS